MWFFLIYYTALINHFYHRFLIFSLNINNKTWLFYLKYMSYFAYACKTEGKNDISRLISETA